MMVAKFGTVVDLEKIEAVTVNRNIEELKEKMRNTEFECTQELRSYSVSGGGQLNQGYVLRVKQMIMLIVGDLFHMEVDIIFGVCMKIKGT